LSYHYHQVLLM